MKEYRVMKEPDIRNVTAPYYIERFVGGWFREKWQKIAEGYTSVQDAQEGIERIEAARRIEEQKRIQEPREVSLGYVANNGKFYGLRRD